MKHSQKHHMARKMKAGHYRPEPNEGRHAGEAMADMGGNPGNSHSPDHFHPKKFKHK